eukprot:scaffold25006_cov64-Phaeocystis_antarctica.AAC.2
MASAWRRHRSARPASSAFSSRAAAAGRARHSAGPGGRVSAGARDRTPAKFSLGGTRGLLRTKQLHGLGLAATPESASGELDFPRRSRVQRCSPLVVCGRLLELRRRARPRLPSVTLPAQHNSPHLRLEPLVVPPLRLGHLGAHLLCQDVEGRCRDPCPVLEAHRPALLGLEEPLCSLHGVPRAVQRCTEAVVRLGLGGPQGDGLAAGPGCSAPVLLRGVLRALSQQLRVRVARLRGAPGCLLRDLAILLLHHPTILRQPPMHLQPLVIHRVPLPSARVPGAVDAAQVRRRHLVLDALWANGMLHSAVAHL